MNILALLLVITPSEAQTIDIVSIGNVTTGSNGQVTFPLVIINASGVAATVIKLSYDPLIVNVTDASMKDFTSSFTFDGSNATNGWIIIKTFKTGTQLKGNITIANITFNAVGTSGESPLTISVISLNDHDGDSIPSKTLNGTFKISSMGTVSQNTMNSTFTAIPTAQGTRKTSSGLQAALAICAIGIIYIFKK